MIGDRIAKVAWRCLCHRREPYGVDPQRRDFVETLADRIKGGRAEKVGCDTVNDGGIDPCGVLLIGIDLAQLAMCKAKQCTACVAASKCVGGAQLNAVFAFAPWWPKLEPSAAHRGLPESMLIGCKPQRIGTAPAILPVILRNGCRTTRST